jgi:hypothetical protein
MAIGQLLGSSVDYLIMDYLSEVTMSLLARAKKKDPDAGYAPDFVHYLAPHLKELKERKIAVVSNAGGINPRSCKAALEQIATVKNVSLRIAIVEGDDLMPSLPDVRKQAVVEVQSGTPLPETVLSANAYLGAVPIARALALGADIVITGRCVDSALALGILIHEFGWSVSDYDKMATGSLVGHLLECGPQVTGGLYTDWTAVQNWAQIGYPIAECIASGPFIITKPDGTGGLVTPPTVAEQVLYEVADPTRYFLPDVTADFSHVKLESIGMDRVRVTGAKGRPPTNHYKVSATYEAGFRAVALVVIIGIEAVQKAERTAEELVRRARALFQKNRMPDFSNVHVEVLGAEASYGKKSRARGCREVVLRLVMDHPDRKALEDVGREVGSVGLSFAQGTAGLIGGRPKPETLIHLFTFFVEKSALAAPQITIGSSESSVVPISTQGDFQTPPSESAPAASDSTERVSVLPADEDLVEVALRDVAHARSGDKGDSANIAIICRHATYWSHLCEVLTSERLAAHFAEELRGPVMRYEVPGLAALNFVLFEALGGGGTASARIDPQGKAFGQRALEIPIRVPRSWLTASPHDPSRQSLLL